MNIPANLIPNSDQVAHAFRWALTSGGSLLTANGVADSNQVATWTGIGIALTPLVQGLFAWTQAAILAKASKTPGIKPIETLPSAPPNVQAVAADANVPNVVPAVPAPSPYATQRRP